jgi:peptidoglycan biosynthesis protein MviN/MurJ (putative lipid II flippase)
MLFISEKEIVSLHFFLFLSLPLGSATNVAPSFLARASISSQGLGSKSNSLPGAFVGISLFAIICPKLSKVVTLT